MLTLAKIKNSLFKAFSGSYTILLIFLVLIFLFHPHKIDIIYTNVWRGFFAATLLLAVFNCKHSLPIKIISLILAIPALVLGLLRGFYHVDFNVYAEVGSVILFFSVCAASILYDSILKSRVNAETLRGVICVYFIIAFIFSHTVFCIFSKVSSRGGISSRS